MSSKPYFLLSKFESLFVGFSLFHLSGAFFPLILSGGASEGDGVDIRTVDLSLIAKIDLLIYFVVSILLFLRWKKVLKVASKATLYWPLIILACFSFFWSSMPDTSFRGAIYALGSSCVGIYIATRYTIKEQLDRLGWTLAFMLFMSIVFVVALPQYGVMSAVHEGAIRGIFLHKNVFAPVVVLSLIVFFLQALDAKKDKWIWWGLFSTSIALGILSRSSTALGLMVVMLSVCVCYHIFRWQYEALVSAVLLILIMGIAGILWFVEFGGAELLFDAVGKDATLSSRTEIWAYVWDSIQLKPWLGYGIRGYWNGLNGPSAYVERAMMVTVHYAHNGFLDIFLSFGLIGLSFFIINLLFVINKSLSFLRNSKTVSGFWPLVLLTHIILSNVTEGNLATLSSISWVLYTTVVFSLVALRNNKISY